MKDLCKLTLVSAMLLNSTVALAQEVDFGSVETSNGVKITEIQGQLTEEVDAVNEPSTGGGQSETTEISQDKESTELEEPKANEETTAGEELDEPKEVEEETTLGEELDEPKEGEEETTVGEELDDPKEVTEETQVDPDVKKLYDDAKDKVIKDLEGVDYTVDVTEDLSKNLLDIINRVKAEGYFDGKDEVFIGKTPIEKDNALITESVRVTRVPKEIKYLSGDSVAGTILVSKGNDGYKIDYRTSKVALDGADLVVKHDGESLSEEYNASNQMVPEYRAKAEVQGEYKVDKILVVKEAPKSQEDLEKILKDKGLKYGEVAQIQKLYLDEKGELVNEYLTVRLGKDGVVDTVVEKGGLNYLGEEKEVEKDDKSEEQEETTVAEEPKVQVEKEQEVQVVEPVAAKGESLIKTGDNNKYIIGAAGVAIVLGLLGLFFKKRNDKE